MTIDRGFQELMQNNLFINIINQAKQFDTGALQAYVVL
jgi:hypothetical protein